MGKQELHCYTRVSTTEQKKSGSSLKSQKEIGQRISKKLNLKFDKKFGLKIDVKLNL